MTITINDETTKKSEQQPFNVGLFIFFLLFAASVVFGLYVVGCMLQDVP